MASQYENPPIFKAGQLVCFQLARKKELLYWNLGEISSFPERKDNEVQIVLIQSYEIPDSFRSRTSLEEWSSLDPVRIEFTREMIILNLLSGQTRIAMKKDGSVIRVSITDLCPATFDRFRRALTTGKTLSRSGKQSFW